MCFLMMMIAMVAVAASPDETTTTEDVYSIWTIALRFIFYSFYIAVIVFFVITTSESRPGLHSSQVQHSQTFVQRL